jgi:hypothetical protein
VNENNITAVNRKLKLNLLVDGWKAEDGKVYLDASEKVLTSDGRTIMDEPKLFTASNIESVSETDSKNIYLNVVITNIDKLVDHFLVQFEVWNRKADQSIKGQYKFYLDNM